MAQIIFTIPDTKRRLNGEFYKRTGSMDYWDLNYVHDPIRATELPRSCHEVATLNRINRQYISADTSATRHVPDPGPDRAGRSRPTHPPIPHTRAHPRSHYNAPSTASRWRRRAPFIRNRWRRLSRTSCSTCARAQHRRQAQRRHEGQGQDGDGRRAPPPSPRGAGRRGTRRAARCHLRQGGRREVRGRPCTTRRRSRAQIVRPAARPAQNPGDRSGGSTAKTTSNHRTTTRGTFLRRRASTTASRRASARPTAAPCTTMSRHATMCADEQRRGEACMQISKLSAAASSAAASRKLLLEISSKRPGCEVGLYITTNYP